MITLNDARHYLSVPFFVTGYLLVRLSCIITGADLSVKYKDNSCQ